MSIIIPANSAAGGGGGYEVSNSLRFGDNTYLAATFGSAPTLATKNTISLWFKRSTLDTLQQLYAANGNTANIIVNSNNTIAFYTNSGQLLGPRVYRDPSAWMHFVFTFDSTQGTASNRFKIYINGVEETSFNNTAYPGLNVASELGVNGTLMEIGTRSNHDRIFEGYQAETAFVDGQALDATSFGEFDSDSGVWRPIDISDLTFGNNGFYLEYKQSGTGTNASGMGADTSGNNLNFAVNNFTAIDQTTDTCTNNFATWNPLVVSNGAVTEGNLKYTTSNSGSNYGYRLSTIGLSSGKWYAETKYTSSSNQALIGIRSRTATAVVNYLGYYNDDWGLYVNGEVYNNNSNIGDIGASWTSGDIVGTYLDLDNNKLYFSKNGALYSSTGLSITAAASTTTGFYFFGASEWNSSGNGTFELNVGNPTFSLANTPITDANGYGAFEYSPTITGDGASKDFLALCTANLSEVNS